MTHPDFLSTFSVNPIDAEIDPEKFNHQAYWLGRCSLLVYPPDTDSKEPAEKGAERIRNELESWGLDGDRFEFIANVGTQCFVVCNDDVIIVCFRGTEVGSLWDIVADLVVFPKGESKQFAGRAHVGFIAALMEVYDEKGTSPRIAGGALPDVIAKLRTNNQKVWLTGHSLGGALATLAAARLIKEGRIAQGDIGGLITFGQPRVGNREFVTGYDGNANLRKRHFRVVNNNDIVPRTPLTGFFPIGKLRLPEFRHVGQAVFVDRGQNFYVNTGSVRLFFRRLGSRSAALFGKGQAPGKATFLSRVLPGLGDHSMTGYQSALDNLIKPA